MADVTGMNTTVNFDVGLIVDMRPLLRLLDPTETPLQTGVGADGLTALGMGPAFQVEPQWQDDTILTPVSTLSANVATTGVTTVSIQAAERLGFSVGDYIRVNDEFMLIDAIPATPTTDLTVTRGYRGSTAATHSSGAKVLNNGQALPEGSDPEASKSREWNQRSNLTQIFMPPQVSVSGTQQVVQRYGLTGTSMFDYQLAKRFIESNLQVENALIYSKRDNTGGVRTMDGMISWISTNVDSSTATLNQATNTDAPTDFLVNLQNCADVGGRPDRTLLNFTNKRHVSAWDASDIRLGRADNVRGQTVDFFDSDFGRITFVSYRWLDISDVITFSREQATILTLRPWQFSMLPKTGDSVKGFMVCEKSLQFEAERWATRFSNLA